MGKKHLFTLNLLFSSYFLITGNFTRNTRSSASGIKTRQFSSIMEELSAAHSIHKEHGTHLGGVHLELTGVRIYLPFSIYLSEDRMMLTSYLGCRH